MRGDPQSRVRSPQDTSGGGSSSQPPHQNTVGYRWRTATAAAGVAGLRLHDLRHFYASGLIASGCDVVAVQRALGHASATTMLNTYSHLCPAPRTAPRPPRRPCSQVLVDRVWIGRGRRAADLRFCADLHVEAERKPGGSATFDHRWKQPEKGL